MKKKFLSLAMALVMCLGLCIPAFAASGASSNAPEINLDLPENGSPDAFNKTYQIRSVNAGGITDKTTNTTLGYVIARDSDPQSYELSVYDLPLGATVTFSNLRSDWSGNDGETDVLGVQVYSDPDGDGVYDQWIFDFESNPPVVPLSEESVAFLPSENGRYSYAAYLTRDNGLELAMDALPSSVTVSADYLSETFGPNTLVLIQIQIWTAYSVSPLTAFQTGRTATLAFSISGEEGAAPAEPETPEAPAAPAAPAFTDVDASAYYADSVAWAVAQEITSGTTATTFSPSQDCTNAQILTFLWRACGEPAPEIDNPFTNTISDAYLQAAVWAYEQGMVSGDTFDSSQPCTRAMAVTYIWQACGSPEPETEADFTDVPADAEYAQAVAWAVKQGVTTGTSDTAATFSPDGVCSRGQIVTFLYRAMADN